MFEVSRCLFGFNSLVPTWGGARESCKRTLVHARVPKKVYQTFSVFVLMYSEIEAVSRDLSLLGLTGSGRLLFMRYDCEYLVELICERVECSSKNDKSRPINNKQRPVQSIPQHSNLLPKKG